MLTTKHLLEEISHPYENMRVGFHLLMTAAYSPITRAEQSNNMWNPSEIRPRLLVHTPYTNSTKVNICNTNRKPTITPSFNTVKLGIYLIMGKIYTNYAPKKPQIVNLPTHLSIPYYKVC